MKNLSAALKHKLLQNINRAINQIPETTSPIFYQSPLGPLPLQQQGFPSNSNLLHGYSSADLTSPDYVEQHRPILNPNNFSSQSSNYKKPS